MQINNPPRSSTDDAGRGDTKMENMRYDYSPLPTRKAFRLPGQARVALWIGINIEHFDIGEENFPGSGTAKIIPPNVYDYAPRDYGNRIGIWRLMEVLDRHGIRASVLLNSDVCRHYPIIIEEAKRRKWEFMGHGTSNSITLNGKSAEEERRIITSTLEEIGSATGQRPLGWLSPALQETFDTPDILAEAGIKYVCDWCADDQPFPMKVKTGTLISVPYTQDMNDIPAFIRRNLTPREFYETVKDQFDVFYREGTEQARVMCIALHPFLIGQPFRIGWFDKAIQYIKSHENVWFATCMEIASWYYDQYMGMTLT